MLASISKPPILLLLLLVPFFLPTTRSSPQTLGLEAFLLEHSRLDPHATNDTFLSLPASLRRSLSASPSAPPPPLSALLDYLRGGIDVSVPVYVRLVGASFSSAAPSILSSFVSAAQSSGKFQVIGHDPHHLAASHSLHLDVGLATHPLLSKISSAVRDHIASSPAPFLRTALHSVPHTVVDDIVQQDFRNEASHSAPGFYIYLLDLGQPPKPYAYSYDGKDSSSSPSPAFTRCMGSLWVGNDRYVWIDLSAGPVEYGPAMSGDGLLPRGDFHPLTTYHGRVKSERTLLADLAALVLSAYHTLMVPSLRIPVFFETSLLIRFIHIHGSDLLDKTGLDFNSIERTIRESGILVGDQSLRFDSVSVKLSECPICSFAVAKSTYSYTSRFLFDNYTLIVSEYLDSKRLHQILTDSIDEVHRSAGITDEVVGRVVPVYVFDLDYDRLLMLDRYHQSVAFRNMVVAVRTRSSQTVSDYSCNGRHVITQTRELERPIMSSLLQSMWGVSPTHLSWSPLHNSTLVDYTWSVGHTPFGPFAETASLSFVQKDAARKNMLITSLNYTVTSAIDVLSSMAAHGGDRKLLKGNRHVEFLQRWNMMKYKLDKAVSSMSHLDFEKASHFLRSSDHDLYSIHNLIYQASQELEASLVCFKDPPFPWASASLSVGVLLVFFYVYMKRDKIFRNKRKRF